MNEPGECSHDSIVHILMAQIEELPTLFLTSFGHRRGPLHPTPDILVDIRNLPNPPRNIRTRQTGLNKPLREAFFANAEVQRRFEAICEQIRQRLQQAVENRETRVSIGVCCELGKHRSVAMVEQLGLTHFDGWNAVVNHRDAHLKRTSHRISRTNRHEGGGSSE